MFKLLKRWSSILLMLAITAASAFAGSNDGKPANDNAANPSPAEATPAATPSLSPAADANVTALLGVLVMKGVLAPTEANAIRNATPETKFQLLVDALNRKGILSAADLSAATNPAAQPSPTTAVTAEPTPPPQRQEVAQNPPQKKPAAPGVVPAVVPVRTVPVDPPKKDALVAAFKAGAVKVTPYGFLKATAVHDSSDPNGDDFPFPGIWLNSSSVLNTGPTRDPSFHLKARSSRFGANFEWPDVSNSLTITGRVEGDFEGGFTEVDNADVSSIRNPTPRLRLAYARLDYASSENTDLFFEAGQDWTLYGSTALPNILETTFLGAYSGDIYERSPQFEFGLVQKLGDSTTNFKIAPTFAIMMPSTGQIYKLNGTLGGFEAQIGEGEREGADSGRPEVEGRLALQFQLDKAPAVSSAQIFWSGYEGKRTGITTSANLAGFASILAQYPAGFTQSSHLFGNQVGVQLPTRWFTVVASAYRGGDMRFMLGGQLNTYFTDVSGLYNVVGVPTVDNITIGAGGMYVGCSVASAPGTCTGTWIVAPQRPIGAFGGFFNLGLPLSRWFNADPKGRNSAWNLYLHVGKDQVVHHDLAHANGFGCGAADASQACTGGLPLSQSRLVAATLYYKLNAFTTFAFEQSQYQTSLLPEIGPAYTIAGTAATKWKDQRTEFGPIFTF